MLKRQNKGSRKSCCCKGFSSKRSRERRINASTAYETCNEQLSPFDGLLASIKFIDLVGFRKIFHFAYRPPSGKSKLGNYLLMVGILMLLFIGFNRIWYFVYVRLDAMLCGFFPVHPAASSQHLLALRGQYGDQSAKIFAESGWHFARNRSQGYVSQN